MNETVRVKELKNARKQIDRIHLQNYPMLDLRSSDMAYIEAKNNDSIFNMMYDAYKLGFSRALEFAGAEPPKNN